MPVISKQPISAVSAKLLSRKCRQSHYPPENAFRSALSGRRRASGGYSFSSKSINLNKLVKGKNETLSPKDEAIISKVNRVMPRTRLHERGHEYADRHHVYGPGISPEQRAIVNMNDEMAAVASELYLCICYYRQKLRRVFRPEKLCRF